MSNDWCCCVTVLDYNFSFKCNDLYKKTNELSILLIYL